MKDFKKQTEKAQRKTEKWLPKIIRVNGMFGRAEPELNNSIARKEGKKVMIVEIIEENDNISIGGSRYQHVTKRKIEDVLMNRLRKVPFLPIYFVKF